MIGILTNTRNGSPLVFYISGDVISNADVVRDLGLIVCCKLSSTPHCLSTVMKLLFNQINF